MCGRYALHTHPDIIALQFGVIEAPQMKPRFNIAPTQEAPIVRVRVDPEQKRELALLRWGLIPSWSKDPSIGARLINARAESVAEKPSFRSAFRRRRCLVPADGYYEWKVEGGRKQPYFLQLASGEPFAMAGLWEQWRSPEEGKLIETYAIVTTEAAGAARRIVDRMPVILAQPEYEAWLCSADPGGLLRPWAGAAFSVRRVSPRVNSPRFDDPQCLDEGGHGAVGGP